MDPYWTACTQTVDAIQHAKPRTAAEVVTILRAHDPQTDDVAGDAFWSASNAGDDLLPLLIDAGWQITRDYAPSHWQATHPATGDQLEYIEGDVYDRTPQAA